MLGRPAPRAASTASPSGAPAGRPAAADGLAAYFPTADQIALALVTACRMTGESAISCALGQQSRGRHVAFQALALAFPQARRLSLARCTGYQNRDTAQAQSIMAKRHRWWSEEWVDEIVGLLVAPLYDEGETDGAQRRAPDRAPGAVAAGRADGLARPEDGTPAGGAGCAASDASREAREIS